MNGTRSFRACFEKATGQRPFGFQWQFARDLPALIHVPTGLGKTAMAVVGWLWRRFSAGEDLKRSTPRRLVYCLPMRVLVEQTAENTREWVRKLKDAGRLSNDVHVYVLMGGEDEDDWDVHPERDAIIIGTQDMLLSRALNRGYAASRARWPMQFGLLHTDCLWVFDEIQLMGTGLATTAQIEAFRRLLGSKDGHSCRSVWMSATLDKRWLETVDFKEFLRDKSELSELRFDFEKEMKDQGLNDEARQTLKARWTAKKSLAKAKAEMGNMKGLAREILDVHKPGARTIVVLNTVKRACELFEALNITDGDGPKKGRKSKKTRDLEKDAGAPAAPKPRMVLLHSRFRPDDRKKHLVDEALAKIKPGEPGTIVVSTQVIEAGVNVSATRLFTELAPWASLVQRFGRCNRKGETDQAQVFWIDVSKDQAAPYDAKDLDEARKQLQGIGNKPEEERNVGLKSLPTVELPFEHIHVIRCKDLIDLFDTTPDLAGNDIDIDRFVREVEDSDVRVFWRDWEQPKSYESPPEAEPAPRREELCPAPVGSDKNPGFRQFAKDHSGKVCRWNFLDRKWEKADPAKIVPGQVYLVHADAGGYSAERGWDPDSQDRVEPVGSPTKGDAPEANEDERLSRIGVWQTIAEHTDDVCRELDSIIVGGVNLTDSEHPVLTTAARWHDRGKAHDVFQNAIDDGQSVELKGKTVQRKQRPNEWKASQVVAKAPGKRKDTEGKVVDVGFWRRYDWLPKVGRKHFRHELVSALAVVLEGDGHIPVDYRDLVAYLIAAHHGKVRLSIRSLPNERRPDGNLRFARGVWDHDELPATELGGGVTAPAVTLSLKV